MSPTLLRMNTTPVYRFLCFIHSKLPAGDTLRGKRILDCGAGGPTPPLAVFAEQGMQCVGIDISKNQIEAARQYAGQSGTEIELREADMREIPFADASFDYVYEHFSMCHLSMADTAQAVREMWRILKPGGLAFLGIISAESWPISSYGREREPGEYWMIEGGKEVFHCMFTDAQASELVRDWDVLLKERTVLHVGGEEISEAEWADLHVEARFPCTTKEWAHEYDRRNDHFRYVHSYYYLRKPS